MMSRLISHRVQGAAAPASESQSGLVYIFSAASVSFAYIYAAAALFRMSTNSTAAKLAFLGFSFYGTPIWLALVVACCGLATIPAHIVARPLCGAAWRAALLLLVAAIPLRLAAACAVAGGGFGAAAAFPLGLVCLSAMAVVSASVVGVLACRLGAPANGIQCDSVPWQAIFWWLALVSSVATLVGVAALGQGAIQGTAPSLVIFLISCAVAWAAARWGYRRLGYTSLRSLLTIAWLVGLVFVVCRIWHWPADTTPTDATVRGEAGLQVNMLWPEFLAGTSALLLMVSSRDGATAEGARPPAFRACLLFLGMVTLLALSDVASASSPVKSDVWETSVHYWTTLEFVVVALGAVVIAGILIMRSLAVGLRLIRHMVWHKRPQPPIH